MKHLLSCIALILVSTSAYSQTDVAPDTLDWRGYYPLEIGNTWEWETEILVAYTERNLREIVGDTLFDGKRYFIEQFFRHVVDPIDDIDTTFIGRNYLRYDSLSTQIMARSYVQEDEWVYTCALGANFGAVIACDKFGEANVHGEYFERGFELNIGSDIVHVKGIKAFYNIGFSINYYHGIGRLQPPGDGQAGDTYFTYIKIGGKEFGHRAIHVGTEVSNLESQTNMEVFPNPADKQINLKRLRTDLSVNIYDVLGRLIETIENCQGQVCRVDISNYPLGLYFIREMGDAPTFHSFVVAR